jgi:hypothetical protein
MTIIKNSVLEYINTNLTKLEISEGLVQVGYEFPKVIKNKKGAILELLPKGSYFLKLVVDNLDFNDINVFRNDDIIFKVLFNRDKAYILIKFGGSNLLHEILFDPTLYFDKSRTLTNLKISNLIYCVLINSENSVVHGIKIFNFPIEIFQKLIFVWEKALDNKNYSEEFKIYTANFFSKDISFWWENIG